MPFGAYSLSAHVVPSAVLGCDNPPGFKLFPRSLSLATGSGYYALLQSICAACDFRGRQLHIGTWGEPVGFRVRQENFRKAREQISNVGIMTECSGRLQPPACGRQPVLAIDHA
jgi:hypothetical protein